MIASLELKRMTDEELVRLYVASQSNRYFEHLYSRYSDKVYRKCLMFTKDPVKAEDFTHDIFMRLIVRLSSFKEQSKFSTWLFSITYNYCTDQLRSNRKKTEVPLNEEMDWLDDGDDKEVMEMEAQRLQKALGQLTLEEQSLLLMKYQDEVSIREIAAIHNLSESAVKMRLKRAKEKLKKRYLETMLFIGLLLAKFFAWIKIDR
ncbi:RNA polymerase sigma-70 factor (ECF subfamily) [Larkinella arboricola]|uniref:RNA polymerase sigma-70 factor (ECF subfamily) n=1 Tax=Larkinella arboricola TaxID=643671 RepID=A0A327WZF9_LARAB|nr:sigma-70 family RNA polymerase sigma factor [Larkinella arboricola]RAJ98116.1 RNA polymerase sigma-70 factor (ECF subfamily) [Larkinella arboricola]